ncbi:MAG: hypothetical protein IPM57_00730 [Oligoflexia bacterium]|nr:hypothetical protein [Oligoflexia bacterium]
MKILVFSPSNAIWNWAYPTALVAESLQKSGDSVWFLTCDKEYSKFCMAQAASGVKFSSTPSEKDVICDLCISQRDLIANKLNLNKIHINDFITHAERDSAKQMANNANVENHKKFLIADVPVGKLAMFEMIIQNKKKSLTFSDEELTLYQEILFNVIKTVTAFVKVLEDIKPDVCIIEHTAYSYNRACQTLSTLHNIPAYCINGNSYNNAHCFELLTIAKDDPIMFVQNYLKAWPNVKHIPISISEATYVTDHFISLLTARGHVYSAAKKHHAWSIRSKYGIKPNQKILLATTSSPDEIFATEMVGNFAWNTKSDVFETQIEWLRNLFQFIKTRQDLFLIVRVHPREFMPGQNGEISEHAKALQAEFKSMPENVVINWPTDNLSIYDLMEETDVVLNAWSTAGLEMTYFGIPVVVYCGHMLLYPEDLVYSAKSRDEYFVLIDKAINNGWNYQRILRAYRWCATQHLYVSANISDSFSYNLLAKKPFGLRLLNKLGSFIDPLFREKMQISTRASILKKIDKIRSLLLLKKNTFLDVEVPSPNSSLKNEEQAIKSELRRLYKSIYGTNKQPAQKNGLQFKLWNFLYASH